ncbi:MAG: NusG domain II-containing protein [Oscillospiraceae bacterium]|nr:NusG domain II-containing protein [Oscillospiraceae bacterium]
MEEKRSFQLKKTDWAIIGVLLVLAVGSWLFYRISYQPPKEQNLAVIMVDGKEWMQLNLLEEADRTFSLKESCGIPVSFQIKDHKIRFIEVDCPDHICENAGFLSMEGQTAVCMPNRVSLSIYGDEG